MTDRDPLALLAAQEVDRLPSLVALRRSRMAASPLAFLRGAAAIMAHDLDAFPNSGVTTQICGDAHLLNFGLYATAERRLVFDLNDFDETAQGPWEWDVLRLAASVVIAARSIGSGPRRTTEAVAAVLGGYRDRITRLAELTRVDAWVASIDAGDVDQVKGVFHAAGPFLFEENPPLVTRVLEAGEADGLDASAVAAYGATLPEGREVLARQYRMVELVRKVVGIGSVGLRSFAVLLEADPGDRLVLQVKQATRSVVAASPSANEGRRVVSGQRLMQAASDPFLGWVSAGGRDYHVRQLRDYRYEPRLEEVRPKALVAYAGLCGHALALGHGRSGAARAIRAALADPMFAERAAAHAIAYADRTERDHAALVATLAHSL